MRLQIIIGVESGVTFVVFNGFLYVEIVYENTTEISILYVTTFEQDAIQVL